MAEALTNTIDFLDAPQAASVMDAVSRFRDEMAHAMALPHRVLSFRMERCAPELSIIEDETLIETVEDWSRVRSPGRARRRRGKHPQNIKITSRPSSRSYLIGDKLICHPATADAVRKYASEKSERIIDELFRKFISGAA